MRRSARGRSTLAIAAAVVVTGALAPTTEVLANGGGGGGQPKPPTVTVIASGLLNPRGVSVGIDGSVYVAESGVGGPTLAEAQIEGEPSAVCLGNTGGVTVVRRGKQSRLVDLPSFSEAATTDAGPTCDSPDIGFGSTGPSDVVALLDGSVSVVVGLGGNGEVRAQIPAPFGDSFGKLLHVSRRGNVSEIADISGYEDANNPEPTAVDSNPYSVTAYLGGHLVADAGGNDVLRVNWRGQVSTVAVLPSPVLRTTPQLSCGVNTDFGLPPAGTPIPSEAVPTSVVVGPDGAFYVGQLTGFPFAPGEAKVYRINPRTGAITEFATGFTNIVGIAFGPDGSMYVVEITRNGLLNGEICGEFDGRLVKVRRGVQTEIPVPGLTAPGGVAVGLDGTVYVSNLSVIPGGAGQLLAIRQR